MAISEKKCIVKTVPVINLKGTGENIVRLRDEAGLSARELANEIGVSYQAVYRWERGVTLPTIDNLAILAAVLQCTMDDIIATSFTTLSMAPRRGRADTRRG